MKKKGIIYAIIGVVLAVIVVVAILAGRKEVHISTTTAVEGKLEHTVMATGYVQPLDDVDVGTQVSGVIEKIYVDYNSQVKKGDLLAELEKLTLQEKVNQARASLESAQSNNDYAKQNYARVRKLYDSKATTMVTYEDAINKLAQTEAEVVNAKANLHQAEVNLSYAYIYSPIDGVVLDRAVGVGQTVAASFNTPTLFTIAEDLTKMIVEADVDEADIGRVMVGQKVQFTVDAYSEDIFEGTVDQIRLQPTVTNNVVTYTVIINAPNPEKKLYPGMTASITITVKSAEGLLLPAQAVNYRMPQDVAAKLKVNSATTILPDGANHAIWVMAPGSEKPELRYIHTQDSDGVDYLVSSGVSAGEKVITSAILGKKKNQRKAASNPLMPTRSPGGNRGGGRHLM